MPSRYKNKSGVIIFPKTPPKYWSHFYSIFESFGEFCIFFKKFYRIFLRISNHDLRIPFPRASVVKPEPSHDAHVHYCIAFVIEITVSGRDSGSRLFVHVASKHVASFQFWTQVTSLLFFRCPHKHFHPTVYSFPPFFPPPQLIFFPLLFQRSI